MNFSENYLIYPVNPFLEHAVARSIPLLDSDAPVCASADGSITVADNFLFTRGNHEQHRFNANVLESIRETLASSLQDIDQENSLQDWAERQNDLGNVFAALGQQQRDMALFTKSIECFSNALEAYNQSATPFDWAATQYNLATAKQAVGRLNDELNPLKSAIDAYTNALLVWTREDDPQEWMRTMHQLGATFHAYGKRLKGNRTFQKSVVAYKNALAVLNADDYPLELTATHNNRGVVLHHLAESEENPQRFEEAIKSYDKALTVSMEQQLPVHLSVICRVNKLTAGNALAGLSHDAVLAEEVADEFEVIIECFPHALQPLCLKHCEAQLNLARRVGLVY